MCFPIFFFLNLVKKITNINKQLDKKKIKVYSYNTEKAMWWSRNRQ